MLFLLSRAARPRFTTISSRMINSFGDLAKTKVLRKAEGMNHVLLLGAGFSRNWGGLLADEFFSALIGVPEIREDDYLKGLLWKFKNSGGFENALGEIQSSYLRDPAKFEERLKCLQNAVLNIIERMNEAFFELNDIEFQPFRERQLRTFMFNFDAVFTLNQDVLLEHFYCRHLQLSGVKGWSGSQLPGMRRISGTGKYIRDPSWGRDRWVPLDKTEFKVEKNLQPLFKLHGSSNWRNEEGGELLVLGGQKSRAITSNVVLEWYFNLFREFLSRPGVKLFVIGYGFKDLHVNEVIINAVKNNGLEFFVIDPLGSDIARRVNLASGGAIYDPRPLDEAFEIGLIGASTRSLREIFGENGGVSHGEVMRFFNDSQA